MLATSDTGPWAVYQMALKNKAEPMRVICQQSEWNKMDQSNPGSFVLIRGEISSEVEAERLARETAVPVDPLSARFPRL